jgi:hypothetical protein
VSELAPPLPPDVPPPPPAPTPPGTAPAPVSNTAIVVGILTLLVGLACLVPGCICSVMAVGMQFASDSESKSIGVVFAVIGVPALLIGFLLTRFGWRKLAGKRRPATT